MTVWRPSGSADNAIAVAGGVGVLVIRDGRLLLGLRAHQTTGGGTWAPPGGKIDEAEGPLEAGIRELREETGLVAMDARLVGVLEDRFSDRRPWVTAFIVVHAAFGTPRLCEPDACMEWSWFGAEDLPAPLFQPFAAFIGTDAWKGLAAEPPMSLE